MITEGLASLDRYFIWSNRMRLLFDNVLKTGEHGTSRFSLESRMYMSYWYASLYVVIEGWHELKLSDSTIDALLQSKNVDLLRRYRNGVFHYQKTYNDDRFVEFIKEGEDTVNWVRGLTSAFDKYLLDEINGQKS